MPKLFTWLIGQNVLAVVTPQVRDVDGNLTNHGVGALSMIARLDDGGLDQNTVFTTENITPMDCPYSNPVVFEQGTSIAMTEIQDSSGVSASGGNKLWVAALNSLFHKVDIYMKDISGANILVGTFYGTMVGWNPSWRKGKCVGLMNLESNALPGETPGTYTANPSYT